MTTGLPVLGHLFFHGNNYHLLGLRLSVFSKLLDVSKVYIHMNRFQGPIYPVNISGCGGRGGGGRILQAIDKGNFTSSCKLAKPRVRVSLQNLGLGLGLYIEMLAAL